MTRPGTRRRGGRAAGLLLLAAALGSGCYGLKRDVGLGEMAPEVAVNELTTQEDYERLKALGANRGQADARSGYRIGPDDLLEIRIPELLETSSRGLGEAAPGVALPTVREVPVFAQGFRVSSHGDVTLPMLGAVHAEGLTTGQLEQEIADRLKRADILRKPHVSVQLAEYRAGVVAVMGSVEKPGLYPITRPGATIADLIWAAGGPTKEAGRVVSFSPGGSSDPIRLDLEMLVETDGRDSKDVNVRVAPGDVIGVAPAGSVLVDGWVEKPGAYPVTRGLTLIGAVAAAGGNHFAADRHNATVQRSRGPREHEVFTVDLDKVSSGAEPDFPLTDGDIVRVPPSAVKMVPYGVWKVVTSAVAIGASFPLF